MSQAYVSTLLRKLVFDRADGRCEYCKVEERRGFSKHQIDHIIALKHGGETYENNLALCCMLCNLHKGSDISSLDLETGIIAPLFNPRRNAWPDHFFIDQGYLVGRTPIGRGTIRLLQLNSQLRVDERLSQDYAN